ncbi:MAG: hypothetical protein HY860_02605 [Chlamydiales bacterium]|nr:hypothetical protein [Chlamydiales bacterium]
MEVRRVASERELDSPAELEGVQSGKDTNGRLVTLSTADTNPSVKQVAEAAMQDRQQVTDRGCFESTVEWIRDNCCDCIKTIIRLAVQYICCCCFADESPLDDLQSQLPPKKDKHPIPDNSEKGAAHVDPTTISLTPSPSPARIISSSLDDRGALPIDDSVGDEDALEEIGLNICKEIEPRLKLLILGKLFDGLLDKIRPLTDSDDREKTEQSNKAAIHEAGQVLATIFNANKEGLSAETVQLFLGRLKDLIERAPVGLLDIDTCMAALRARLAPPAIIDDGDNSSPVMMIGGEEKPECSPTSDAGDFNAIFAAFDRKENPTSDETKAAVVEILEKIAEISSDESIDLGSVGIVLESLVTTWLDNLHAGA